MFTVPFHGNKVVNLIIDGEEKQHLIEKIKYLS